MAPRTTESAHRPPMGSTTWYLKFVLTDRRIALPGWIVSDDRPRVGGVTLPARTRYGSRTGNEGHGMKRLLAATVATTVGLVIGGMIPSAAQAHSGTPSYE